jgi:hypothetical protein
MDLYSYINNYSQNKTSLEIPKLVFHQAHLVKYLVFLESQRRMAGEVGFDIFVENDRLVHGDGSPVSEYGNFFTGIPITTRFPQARSQHAAPYSGEI